MASDHQKSWIGDLVFTCVVFLTFVAMVAAMHRTVPFIIIVFVMAVELRFMFKRLPPPEREDDASLPAESPPVRIELDLTQAFIPEEGGGMGFLYLEGGWREFVPIRLSEQEIDELVRTV